MCLRVSYKKKIWASLKSLKKGVGSDPDPHKNVKDPQHCFQESLYELENTVYVQKLIETSELIKNKIFNGFPESCKTYYENTAWKNAKTQLKEWTRRLEIPTFSHMFSGEGIFGPACPACPARLGRDSYLYFRISRLSPSLLSLRSGRGMSTKYIYLQSTTCSVCLLFGIGTLPPPLSPASVPLPPEPGGFTRLRVRGWGEPQFRRLEKRLSTLSALWVWGHC